VLIKHSDHPNIARFYGAYRHELSEAEVTEDGINQEVWMVMELCSYGSANDLASNIRLPKHNPDNPVPRKPDYLKESVIKYIMFESLKGLEYLHDNKVAPCSGVKPKGY
jgi:serine/threonine protein kinase